MKSLKESLFDTNLKSSKTVPEKLAYVLRKFFGKDVALCEDHQGGSIWYEINPDTVTVADGRNLYARIINYCKKIDDLDVHEEKLPGFSTVKGYRIGNDEYWMYLNTVKYGNKNIRVSEEFYKCGILPQDQTGVARRGWEAWQRQRL